MMLLILEGILLLCLLSHTAMCCSAVAVLLKISKQESTSADSGTDEDDDDTEEAADANDNDDWLPRSNSGSLGGAENLAESGVNGYDSEAESVFNVISGDLDIYCIADFIINEKKNKSEHKQGASLLLQALIGYVWLECKGKEKSMHTVLQMLSSDKNTLKEFETEFSVTTCSDVLFGGLAAENAVELTQRARAANAIVKLYDNYKNLCRGNRLPVIKHCINRLMPYYYGFSLKVNKHALDASWELTDPDYLITGLTRREDIISNMADDAYEYYEKAFSLCQSKNPLPLPPMSIV